MDTPGSKLQSKFPVSINYDSCRSVPGKVQAAESEISELGTREVFFTDLNEVASCGDGMFNCQQLTFKRRRGVLPAVGDETNAWAESRQFSRTRLGGILPLGEALYTFSEAEYVSDRGEDVDRTQGRYKPAKIAAGKNAHQPAGMQTGLDKAQEIVLIPEISPREEDQQNADFDADDYIDYDTYLSGHLTPHPSSHICLGDYS